MALELTDHQARMLRMRSQRLLPSASSSLTAPVQVLEAVCGVQAQDLPSGLLSLRPRGSGLTAADVEQARQQVQERAALAWIWCMRGTLHLVSAEDARRLVPFYGPDLAAGDWRRLKQLGWDPASAERGLRLVEDALEERGALTRAEIRDLMAANGLPSEGQAPVHLIFLAAAQGMLCYGPKRGEEIAFARFEDWLGRPEPMPRPEALAWLARRYLEAYAPAGLEDFASWAGLRMREARQGWEAISHLTVEAAVQEKPACLLETQRAWVEETDTQSPLVRLLPRYDTYLLGYANRGLSVHPRDENRVHPGGGQISAVVLVDGMAAGLWKTQRKKAALEVHIEPFERLAENILPGLQAEVDDLGRFLGEQPKLVIEKK